MKKLHLLLTLLVLPVTAVLFNGCILDAFDEIKQNLSVDRTFLVSGNTNAAVKQTATFKLTDSQLYRDNKDKITKMKYKAAAFCVSNVSLDQLQGDVILTLTTSTGVPLFSKTLTGFKPKDYVGIQAKNLDLTASEITAIDSYLSNISQLESLTFVAGIEVRNATPANTVVSMNSFVSMVFEMTMKP